MLLPAGLTELYPRVPYGHSIPYYTKKTTIYLAESGEKNERYVIPPYMESLRIRVIDLSDDFHLPYFRGLGLLTKLELVGNFDSPLVDLPAQLCVLILGAKFDQPICHPLSEALEWLEFGCDFNQPFGVFVPRSLRVLILGNRFNRPTLPMPAKLEYMVVGTGFNAPIAQFARSLLMIWLPTQTCRVDLSSLSPKCLVYKTVLPVSSQIIAKHSRICLYEDFEPIVSY